MDQQEKSTNELIGKAVCASQLFEGMFVISMRFAVKQAGAQTIEDVVQISESKAFKQPVKALLNEVSGKPEITQDLEDRISDYLEKRHRVVHRLCMETGWPGQVDKGVETEIRNLCQFVEAESIELAGIVYKMMLGWIAKFPGLQEGFEAELSARGVPSRQ